MSFEEEFPSLAGKRKNLGCKIHTNCAGGEERDYIIVPELRKHCLDKQLVKEVLIKANEIAFHMSEKEHNGAMEIVRLITTKLF